MSQLALEGLLIKLWQRLPLPLANRIGPHIVKSLG